MTPHKPEPNIIGREKSKYVALVATKAILSTRPSRVKPMGSSTVNKEKVG
jgi:hypothetical protein